MNISIEELSKPNANILATVLNTDSKLIEKLGSSISGNESGESFLTRYNEWQKNTNSSTFTIKKENEVVGLISLSHKNINLKKARIGYWICSKEWKKGICSIAFDEILELGKKEGYKIFEANIPKGNIASIKIWIKNGAELIDNDTHFIAKITI